MRRQCSLVGNSSSAICHGDEGTAIISEGGDKMKGNGALGKPINGSFLFVMHAEISSMKCTGFRTCPIKHVIASFMAPGFIL